VRSPRTTSTCDGKRAVFGLRTIARTWAPVAASCVTTCRPTLPVAPITRTGLIWDHPTLTRAYVDRCNAVPGRNKCLVSPACRSLCLLCASGNSGGDIQSQLFWKPVPHIA
jgi:hypothetical protein